MIKIIETSTNERYLEMENKCQEFMDLFYNTNLPVAVIRKRLGIGPRGEVDKFIQARVKNEPVNSYERGALIRKGEWV